MIIYYFLLLFYNLNIMARRHDTSKHDVNLFQLIFILLSQTSNEDEDY